MTSSMTKAQKRRLAQAMGDEERRLRREGKGGGNGKSVGRRPRRTVKTTRASVSKKPAAVAVTRSSLTSKQRLERRMRAQQWAEDEAKRRGVNLEEMEEEEEEEEEVVVEEEEEVVVEEEEKVVVEEEEKVVVEEVTAAAPARKGTVLVEEWVEFGDGRGKWVEVETKATSHKKKEPVVVEKVEMDAVVGVKETTPEQAQLERNVQKAKRKRKKNRKKKATRKRTLAATPPKNVSGWVVSWKEILDTVLEVLMVPVVFYTALFLLSGVEGVVSFADNAVRLQDMAWEAGKGWLLEMRADIGKALGQWVWATSVQWVGFWMRAWVGLVNGMGGWIWVAAVLGVGALAGRWLRIWLFLVALFWLVFL